MGWNSLGKVLEQGLNRNPYWSIMPQHRQLMFKRAFGLLDSRVPAKKPRKKAFPEGHVAGNIPNYQEDFIDSRKHVTDIFDQWAHMLHAQKSQVVHSFITGDVGALERALVKAYNKRKLADPALAAAPESFNEAVMESFRKSIGLMTNHERLLESTRAQEAKALEDQKAKSGKGKTYNTSKPNAMKGVKVTNKKQAVRNMEIAKG